MKYTKYIWINTEKNQKQQKKNTTRKKARTKLHELNLVVVNLLGLAHRHIIRVSLSFMSFNSLYVFASFCYLWFSLGPINGYAIVVSLLILSLRFFCRSHCDHVARERERDTQRDWATGIERMGHILWMHMIWLTLQNRLCLCNCLPIFVFCGKFKSSCKISLKMTWWNARVR